MSILQVVATGTNRSTNLIIQKSLIVDDEVAAGSTLRLLIEKHVSVAKEIRHCTSRENVL